MRWSIVRVIWLRELKDQLRDRRTLFMIAVLPILLYPLLGLGMAEVAGDYGQEPQIVGLYGIENLPHEPDPPLLVEGPDGWQAAPAFLDPDASKPLEVRPLSMDAPAPTDPPSADDLAALRQPLDRHAVDLVVVVPPDFARRLREYDQPALLLLDRDKDEFSRAVNDRFTVVLARWKKALTKARLTRRGLPADFDEPFKIDDPERNRPDGKRAATDLFGMLLRVFPFVLVMWSMAGALYPAVDLCAGEKERGTMETLLISPASREEIVWGKFLTIWVFSAATALLNLFSMGATTWVLSSRIPNDAFDPTVLFWGVLLLLPLSAFFSAVCLAVGAYARSSKEGQYYLMPLFLATLPLVLLTLLPGVELNALYSLVPVTGVALLLQRLISAEPQANSPWMYFIPVLAPMVIYSWLALRWAVVQFQSEEVLFREAERLDVGLWLRRLFREKEALPTSGQALFCFALLLVLRWLSPGLDQDPPAPGATAVSEMAFTAAPALFMALLLTTRPRQGLALRLPPTWSWPAAILLGVLCAPPLAELTRLIHDWTQSPQPVSPWPLASLAAMAVLPAVCEELAFRGFILSGLRRRFHPSTALLLSSFLFALFPLNVFQFAPQFVLGLVLAIVVVRTGSVAPAMALRLSYNLLAAPPAYIGLFGGFSPFLWGVLAAACALLAAGLLAALVLRGKRPPANNPDASEADKNAIHPAPGTETEAASDGAAPIRP